LIGELPDDWKKANVVPVYKKGSKMKPSNYRPISLTCVACKIMEHIITSHIMSHADRHNIIYKFQHGFRKLLSCDTQLIEFVQDLFGSVVPVPSAGALPATQLNARRKAPQTAS
jgi:hypothetical protein